MYETRDQEAVCLGGPLHGSIVNFCGVFLKTPVLSKSWAMVYAEDKPEATPGIILTTEYSREVVRVDYGPLRLEGWVWKWEDLKDEPASTAMGLLLAGALK